MKCLRRNMTEFQYLPYTGTETDLNSDGEHTGEFRPEYDVPVTYKGNISTPSGQTNQTFYGEDIRYSHTLVMDDPNCGIKENGLIYWNGNWYDILAVRPSLNAISIALKRRTYDSTESTPDDGNQPAPGGTEPDSPGEQGETGGGSGIEEPITGETGVTGETGGQILPPGPIVEPEIPTPQEPEGPIGETGETGETEEPGSEEPIEGETVETGENG